MELLERFARGDTDAFETLFRQYQTDVYRWIVKMVRDRAAAEELTVETFWRIWRSRARFDPGREFGAWARRVAANVAVDHLKTLRRDASLPDEWPATPGPDRAQDRDTRDAIREAFGRLPARLRVVATLVFIEERPYGEIAETLGISVGAVKARAFRAVRLLRKKLERMGVKP